MIKTALFSLVNADTTMENYGSLYPHAPSTFSALSQLEAGLSGGACQAHCCKDHCSYCRDGANGGRQ